MAVVWLPSRREAAAAEWWVCGTAGGEAAACAAGSCEEGCEEGCEGLCGGCCEERACSRWTVCGEMSRWKVWRHTKKGVVASTATAAEVSTTGDT